MLCKANKVWQLSPRRTAFTSFSAHLTLLPFSHKQLLIEYHTPVNGESNTGDHPLHVMTKRGRLDVAMKLVFQDVDVNAAGSYGDTPLHMAAAEGHINFVKMLLIFGADKGLLNHRGETALTAARLSHKLNAGGIEKMLAGSTPDRGSEQPPCGYVNQLDTSLFSHEYLRRPRLLCLDGGGIRGLVLTQLLIEIEKRTGRPIRESFDWISGTSTGGIIALALAQGKSAVDCQRLYFAMKDRVFEGSRPYSTEKLESFFKEHLGEKKNLSSIDERIVRVIIPATLADRNPPQLHLFRNYDAPYAGRGVAGKSQAACDQFQYSSDLSAGARTKLESGEPAVDPLLWEVAR